MLPFYKKVGNFTPPNEDTRLANTTTLYNASLYTPNGGPVQVGYPNWANPISSWIQKGLEALGFSNLPGGLADGRFWGFAYTASSIDSRTQSRCSAEVAYLREAFMMTTNMNLYKNTLAKRVLFDSHKNAYGAVVDSGGVEYTLNATKEVIVSAGFLRYARGQNHSLYYPLP